MRASNLINNPMRNLFSILMPGVIFCGIFSLAACQQEQSNPTKNSPATTEHSTFSKIMNTVTDTSDVTMQELEKLRQYEYKVLSVESDNSEELIQNQLNDLGKENWDCHSVIYRPDDDKIQIFCRRRITTPLRYLPQYLKP